MDPHEIIKMVCEEFALTYEQMCSRSRKQDICFPRHVAIYLIRQNTTLTLRQISKLFLSKKGGMLDHTTIIHANSTIKSRLTVDPSLYLTISKIQSRIDDITLAFIKAMEVEKMERQQRYMKMVQKKINGENRMPELIIAPFKDITLAEHEKTINKYL